MPLETRKMSAKVVVLIALAIITFVFGLFLGNSLVFVTVPVLVYLCLAFLQFDKPHTDVRVVRTLEKSQINEKDLTKVRLRLTNMGVRDIPLLNVADKVPWSSGIQM